MSGDAHTTHTHTQATPLILLASRLLIPWLIKAQSATSTAGNVKGTGIDGRASEGRERQGSEPGQEWAEKKGPSTNNVVRFIESGLH